MIVCLSVCLFCLSVLSVCLSICLFISLSVRPSACLSVCPSVCLSVCLPVCLSVCLSVSNITEKRMNRFSKNFQDRWDLVQGIFCDMFHVPINPMYTVFIFLFQGNPCLLAILQKDEHTFMKFLPTVGPEASKNLVHFRDAAVNRLNPGLIFYIPYLRLLVLLWKNGGWDFQEIVRKCQARHQKYLVRLFHACTRLFHDIPSRRGSVPVSSITVKCINWFSWNIQDGSPMIQRTTCNIWGMMCLTLWILGSFFLFSGSVSVSNISE